MAEYNADNSCLLADKALHVTDQVRLARAFAGKLFAEIAVRIVAYLADTIAILFAVTVLNDHVLALDDTARATAGALMLLGYFTASWASRLQATPFQFVFRLRVLHESGRPLSMRESAMRSVLLVALSAFALYVLNQFFVPGMWLKVAAVALLLYVPSVTRRRQGVHDLLAKTVVINRRALRSVDDERCMQALLADGNAVVARAMRPSIYKMAGDAVVLGIPLVLMGSGFQVAYQKDLYARVAYALGEVQETKHLAKTCYESTGKWPQNETELGRPLRHNYPAGGYYELQQDGVIRIQFEIVPELRDGSILIEPAVDDGEVTWHCRAVGDIARHYLPGGCRDTA